jgi:hypothetical protein
MSRLRPKAPSPALIISFIALFAALGGTSYAALANGSVGTAQLRNKAVTNAKLAPLSVGTAKIRDAAVSQAKLAITTQSASVGVPPGQRGSVTAGCPSGSVVMDGGGGFPGPFITGTGLLQSSNASGTSGWQVQGFNNSGVAQTLVARVVCIRP